MDLEPNNGGGGLLLGAAAACCACARQAPVLPKVWCHNGDASQIHQNSQHDRVREAQRKHIPELLLHGQRGMTNCPSLTLSKKRNNQHQMKPFQGPQHQIDPPKLIAVSCGSAIVTLSDKLLESRL